MFRVPKSIVPVGLSFHQVERPKSPRRLDRCQCSQRPLLTVKGDQLPNIYVAYTAPIGEAEGLGANVIPNPLDATVPPSFENGLHAVAPLLPALYLLWTCLRAGYSSAPIANP